MPISPDNRSQMLTHRLATTCQLLCTILYVSLILADTATVAAEGTPQRVRIDSRIYPTAENPPPPKPLHHFVSLIEVTDDGLLAYDFALRQHSGEPDGEVTVFDAARQRYVLLDLTRRVRMEMTWDDVAKVIAHTQVLASRQTGLLKTASSAEFTEVKWHAPDRWVLSSDALSYEAQLQFPPDKQFAAYYREFADAFARWNTVRSSLPPQARMALNEKIAAKDGVPEVIIMTRRTADGKSATQASRHAYVWSWSSKDQQRVRLFEQAVGEYQRVSPREYLHPTPDSTAKRPANAAR